MTGIASRPSSRVRFDEFQILLTKRIFMTELTIDWRHQHREPRVQFSLGEGDELNLVDGVGNTTTFRIESVEADAIAWDETTGSTVCQILVGDNDAWLLLRARDEQCELWGFSDGVELAEWLGHNLRYEDGSDILALYQLGVLRLDPHVLDRRPKDDGRSPVL